MHLLAEQEELLALFVEADRSGGVRRPFLALGTMNRPDLQIKHPGLREDIRGVGEPDLDALSMAGMIDLRHARLAQWSFSVTNEGIRYYEEIKDRRSTATANVEDHVLSYLSRDGFRSRYPTAHAKWGQAEELVWRADTRKDATTIGHLLREAMQEFAFAACGDERAAKSKSIRNVKSALDGADHLGSTEKPFLEALVEYWEQVVELTQRQEHGAEKEGEQLNWEDSRRVVFHTALIMYEIDRALQ